jgi:hypothetical protein
LIVVYCEHCKSTYVSFLDYFYYSDEITLNKPSKLTIESSEDICLSIFVSVNKNCYLNMILKMNQNIVDNKTVEGFNEHNSLKMWKKIEIRSNSSGKGELIFYRKRSDNNQTKGYWAIDDIHFCDKKIGNDYRDQIICIIYLQDYSQKLFQQICLLTKTIQCSVKV